MAPAPPTTRTAARPAPASPADSGRRRLRRRARRFAAPLALVAALAITAAACAPEGSPGTYSGDVVVAINQDRAASGLGPLAWDGQLAPYAQAWAQQLAANGAMVHTDLGAMIRLPWMVGWRALGENLIMTSGVPPAGAVEDAWMGSPPHRANILNGGFNRVGVGTATDQYGRLFVVTEFGAR